MSILVENVYHIVSIRLIRMHIILQKFKSVNSIKYKAPELTDMFIELEIME